MVTEVESVKTTELQGLGGWLVLVGIGTVLAPIRMAGLLFVGYAPMFSDGVWASLMTNGSVSYNPLLALLISGEIIVNSAIFLASCYLVFLFFERRLLFPLIFVYVTLASFIFVVLDSLLASLIVPGQPIFDLETTKSIAQSLIMVAVWIPYMLTSKRVKATFIVPSGTASDE